MLTIVVQVFRMLHSYRETREQSSCVYEFRGRTVSMLLMVLRYSQSLHRIAIILASITHNSYVEYSVINFAGAYIYLDENALDEGHHDRVFVIAKKNKIWQLCVACNVTFGNAVNCHQQCCGVVFELFDPKNRMRIALCHRILKIRICVLCSRGEYVFRHKQSQYSTWD